MGNKFDYINKDEKPEWNMALFFLVRLDERLNDRDTAFNNGDLLKCYRSLRTIYANVHFFFKRDGNNDDLEEELDRKFNEMSKAITNLSMKGRNMSDVKDGEFKRFQDLIDDITLTLYDLLHEHHLVFPKKKWIDPGRALDSFS